jgi:hypothetical protein
MLTSNPVDPSNRYGIEFTGQPGPASTYPRDDERGLGGTVNLIAAAALLVVAYVAVGFATGSGPAPAAEKVPAPAQYAPVATPVPGEFRLGPGNNDAPGLVVERPQIAPGLYAPIVVATPAPGDFRLGPGNNDAPGIVPAVGEGAGLPDDLHGLVTATMAPAEILPFR